MTKKVSLEPFDLGKPVFNNSVDISKEEEKRIEEWKFEMLCRAFESLQKPKPAMCRCMLEPKELSE